MQHSSFSHLRRDVLQLHQPPLPSCGRLVAVLLGEPERALRLVDGTGLDAELVQRLYFRGSRRRQRVALLEKSSFQ